MRLHSLPQASSTPRVPHQGKYDTFSGPGHGLTWRIIDDVQVAVSAALVRGHVTPESNRISAISITFTLRRPRKIQSRKRSKGPPVHVAVMCDSVSVSRPPSRTFVARHWPTLFPRCGCPAPGLAWFALISVLATNCAGTYASRDSAQYHFMPSDLTPLDRLLEPLVLKTGGALPLQHSLSPNLSLEDERTPQNTLIVGQTDSDIRSATRSPALTIICWHSDLEIRPVKKGGGCHPGLLELPTATQTIRGQVNNDQFGEIVDTPVSRDEESLDQRMRRWAAHQTGAVQGHTCVCANAIKLWKGSGARSSNVASAPRHKFGPATHLVKYLFTKDVSIKPRKVNGGARANPSPAFDMSDEQGRSVE
ncbi:unnamed protein product [Diplocarpon coronariae]